jgi:PhnB protein
MASKKRKPARRAATRRARRPAARKVQPIPPEYGSLTPGLVFKDTRPAIEFYQKAFGARLTTRMDTPDGRVMHAEMKIGDSHFMLGDEAPELGIKAAETLGGSGGALMIYTRDCDALFARAVAAGATVHMPMADQFWGDRYGSVIDPFGHRWAIATRTANLTPRQMAKAAEEFMARMAAQGAPAGG